jgi:ribosomal protein L32
MFWIKRRRLLTRYAWVVAVGAVLISVGLLTAANIDKHSIINSIGYNVALLGMPICACGALVESGALLADYGNSIQSRRKLSPYTKSPGAVRCSNCGFDIVPGLVYCGRCGHYLGQQKQPIPTPSTVRCFRCGKISPAKNRFCGRCGASLKDEDDTKIY